MVPEVKDGLGVLMVGEKPSGRSVVTSPHDLKNNNRGRDEEKNAGAKDVVFGRSLRVLRRRLFSNIVIILLCVFSLVKYIYTKTSTI